MTRILPTDLLAMRNEVLLNMPKDPRKHLVLLTNEVFMEIIDGLDPACPHRYLTSGLADAKRRHGLLIIDFVKAM